jgi:activator of HSP90 ATPase
MEIDKIEPPPKDLGYQIGVRKTFTVSTERMWDFLLSESGIVIWLGQIDMDDFELHKPFKTTEGIEGKLSVFKPDSHIRLRWKPTDWLRYSTVEIRVTNSKGRAAVVFHQTGLFDVEKREALIGYWKGVIGRMEVALVGE